MAHLRPSTMKPQTWGRGRKLLGSKHYRNSALEKARNAAKSLPTNTPKPGQKNPFLPLMPLQRPLLTKTQTLMTKENLLRKAQIHFHSAVKKDKFGVESNKAIACTRIASQVPLTDFAAKCHTLPEGRLAGSFPSGFTRKSQKQRRKR